MTRVLKKKELIETRLAANYGGWMYCDVCGENIGYLCYSTYDNVSLKYQCNCGNRGSAQLNFENSNIGEKSGDELSLVKNRYCCPKDQEPLITILATKVAHYELEITCKACGRIYKKEM